MKARQQLVECGPDPKKTAVVITFFNPDCEHCQHEATRLAKSMDKLKKIDFIWATYAASFEEINAFAKKYHLDNLPNVHFVKDVNYSIPSFYHLEMTPTWQPITKKDNLSRLLRPVPALRS
ncbi:redoxin domain-containing protein [Arachidicoccus ginsenosidivorans]|uniref:Redoxin domain-containing protein n=1 Tax=Arachidicoccus ginsenosidivorans TaxID=496057 RepID=A0A5B8VN88_9BACT|nr:redoxin domain-containing protein [Arachidicoccus ginsenosidivorans]